MRRACRTPRSMEMYEKGRGEGGEGEGGEGAAAEGARLREGAARGDRKVRRSEEEGRVKQTNEGKWEFRFDEMSRKDAVLLDVTVPRHLD